MGDPSPTTPEYLSLGGRIKNDCGHFTQDPGTTAGTSLPLATTATGKVTACLNERTC